MGLAGYIESPDSSFFLWKNAYQDYHKTSTVPFSFQNWVENTFWENIAQRTGLLKSSSIYGCWTPVWGMRTSVMIDDDAPLSRCVAIGWTAIYVPDRSVVTYGCTTPALVLFESLDLRPYVSPEGLTRTLLAQTATRFPAFSQASHRNPFVTRVGFILPYSRVSFLTTQSEKLHPHSTKPFRRWLIVWKMWAV